jgi:hypothetical protein
LRGFMRFPLIGEVATVNSSTGAVSRALFGWDARRFWGFAIS